MAAPKYYYNEKTLRYERARLHIGGLLLTITGVLLTGSLFFLGLASLQNRVVATTTEKALRSENEALKEHYGVLSQRIKGSKIKLALLEKRQDNLTKKFFDVRKPLEYERTSTAVLLNDKESFDKEVENQNARFTRLISRAGQTNIKASLAASVDRADFSEVMNYPGLLPVADADPDLLVSGYGTRINPWHKGKFHHDGIDFAGNRGDNVLAAGNGTVTLVKRSELTAGFGNYIEVDHGRGYVTRYAHLGKIEVRQGQRVGKGQVLALIGLSGGAVAPHLHYEVMKDGHHIDPMRVLVEGMGSDDFHLMAEAASHPNQTLH
jgi:murein DD-endopeptidase MepM/ murein hydrolase activator NlpD